MVQTPQMRDPLEFYQESQWVNRNADCAGAMPTASLWHGLLTVLLPLTAGLPVPPGRGDLRSGRGTVGRPCHTGMLSRIPAPLPARAGLDNAVEQELERPVRL